MQDRVYLGNYLDGLMLSDGHIRITSSVSGIYQQTCIMRNWIEVISNDLYEYGIYSKIGDNCIYSKKSPNKCYQLWTNVSPYFKKMRERWYNIFYYDDKEGYERFKYRKVIPEYIDLSPECVANWYLGDGNISHDNTGYSIKLSTCCFSKEELEYLSDKIDGVLSIKSHLTSRNEIQISDRRWVYKFLSYIKEYEVPCYSYKFPRGAI